MEGHSPVMFPKSHQLWKPVRHEICKTKTNLVVIQTLKPTKKKNNLSVERFSRYVWQGVGPIPPGVHQNCQLSTCPAQN